MTSTQDERPKGFYWVDPVYDVDSDPESWMQKSQPAYWDENEWHMLGTEEWAIRSVIGPVASLPAPDPKTPQMGGDAFESMLKRAVDAYDAARKENTDALGADLQPYEWHRAALRAALYAAAQPIATGGRAYPNLLSGNEQRELLKMAEQLWSDLQGNNLGGFSDGNRPFYIMNEFRRVIERFSERDVGLKWSKDQLDAALQDDVRDGRG